MQTLQTPALLAALGILAYIGATKLLAAIKTMRAEAAARNKANIDTVARLAMSQEALASELKVLGLAFKSELDCLHGVVFDLRASLIDTQATQEKIMYGTTKACEAIAASTDKHRESVAEFTKMVVGPRSNKDALEQPSDEHKDRVFSEMQHRAAGETPERARELAELEEMQAANSYPAM